MTSQLRSALSVWSGILFLLFIASPCQAAEESAPITAAYTISEIRMEQTADDFLLKIEGNTPPTYTMYELFDPLRIIIDIADAALAESAGMPLDLPLGPVQQLKNKVLTDQDPPITRIEILLAGDHGYTVERQGKDIVIAFAKESMEEQQPAEEIFNPDQGGAVEETPGNLPAATLIESIEVDSSAPAVTRVLINADGSVAGYKKAQLKKGANRPDRMYIDIPGIKLQGRHLFKDVGTSLARIRAAQRQDAVRIVFDSGLDTLFQYEIETQPAGLAVTIHEPSQAETIIAGIMEQDEAPAPPPEQLGQSSSESSAETVAGINELIQPVIPRAKAKIAAEPAVKAQTKKEEPPKQEKEKKEASPQNTFAFAGYEKQKITVDFFKIDLHNVFRLFGEISGLNMVIDEGVKGSLTLALNEVPWDFALDIILNLKDLQKEERFNTIVISPKAKEFIWPKTATDQIAFKADGGKVEAISVKQRLETPKEVLEAKKLIHKAQELDKTGQYAEALEYYEKAFAQWPDNSQLASRISALCLVRLGMNAKAVHYAKAAIQADPENYNAGLQAAISLANMKKVEEAKKFFDFAISGEKPASEALISYAAFAEEYQSYQGSLALLKKHEQLHGDTLDTLVAKARIHDKLGDSDKAVDGYRAVLLSGYDIPADLRQYIQGRIAAATNM